MSSKQEKLNTHFYNNETLPTIVLNIVLLLFIYYNIKHNAYNNTRAWIKVFGQNVIILWARCYHLNFLQQCG